jgi:hypothetical protein
MQPDPEKASRDEAAEKEILKQVKASMTQEDLAELARATKELKEKQETPDPPEALKAVPCLSLQDIPKKPIHVPIEVFPCLATMTYFANILGFYLPQLELRCQLTQRFWLQQSLKNGPVFVFFFLNRLYIFSFLPITVQLD